MSVLVPDGEVALVLSRSDSNADDVPVITSPPWTKSYKVRVLGLQVNGDFFVSGEIWVLSRDVSINLDDIHLAFDLVVEIAVLTAIL